MCKDFGGGVELLPPGAYCCIITNAVMTLSKKGDMAIIVTWDVAEGEHKSHFSGSEFGHSSWIMLQGNGSPYGATSLAKISDSNSVPPVSFDAFAAANEAMAAFEISGKIGQLPVPLFVGRSVGAVVGIRSRESDGKEYEENFVERFITPDEVRAGKYTDSKGVVRDIRIPKYQKSEPAQSAQTSQQAQATQDSLLADDDIPF